jgi:YD repeat-containing protein
MRLRVAVGISLLLCVFAPVAQGATAPPAAGDNGLSAFTEVSTSDYETESVNVANGNLLVASDDGTEADGSGTGIYFERYYNSEPSTNAGAGNWQFSAEPAVKLTSNASGVSVNMPSGASATFTQNADGSFSSTDTSAQLSLANGVYTLDDPSGNTETFDGSNSDGFFGRQISQEAPGDDGTSAIQYDGGPATFPTGLTNSTEGTSLNFDWTAARSHDGDELAYPLEDVQGSASSVYYSYNSTGVLVGAPTSSDAGPTYGYNSAGLLDSITESDGTNAAITYDASGRVTSIIVTDSTGAVTDGYTFSYQDPTSSTCVSDDVGETVVTPAGSDDGPASTYCYPADGVVDASYDPSDLDPAPDDNSAAGVIIFSGPLEDYATAGSSVGAGSTYINTMVSAPSDSVGVTAAELLIDGVVQNASDQTTQSCTDGCDLLASFPVNTSSLAAGTHTATLNASSSDGQTSSESITFTVDPSQTVDDQIPSAAEMQPAVEAEASSSPPNIAAGLAYAWRWRDTANTAYHVDTNDDCTDYISQIVHAMGVAKVSGQSDYSLNWTADPSLDSPNWENAYDFVFWALRTKIAIDLHNDHNWKAGDIVGWVWNHSSANLHGLDHLQLVYRVSGGVRYILQHSGIGPNNGSYPKAYTWGYVHQRIVNNTEWPAWFTHIRITTTQPTL